MLIGLGVQELSVSPGLVGEIKARVRELNAEDYRQRSQELLALGSARAVRDACARFWPHA